jgi:7-cyano-7-deazaguanine synthase in queuosine biosynthesis
MKLVCGPDTQIIADADALQLVLYGQAASAQQASAGASVRYDMQRAKLLAAPRAWDFLSIALSVMTADSAVLRSSSSDGWTREFELSIAVGDPEFWDAQSTDLEHALAFLTTDRWRIRFVPGGFVPNELPSPVLPDEDCIVLVSGGLDSLIGLIDRVELGYRPLVISKTVRGDAEKQSEFAQRAGGGARHLQLNDNCEVPVTAEASQRARSMIFLAFGILSASTLGRYHAGDYVTLNVCENGFIALNPPLTGARIGSLSTRTAHPAFLYRIQALVSAAGLRVTIENPYRLKTKGEMLKECRDQEILAAEASRSTSCGRFQRYNYRHCGRCIPCQVRRGAFIAATQEDRTEYVFEQLGKADTDHAAFDDVRSAAMALAQISEDGLDAWIGSALTVPHLGDATGLRSVIERGMEEIAALHHRYGVT